jgi:hypothetical protein
VGGHGPGEQASGPQAACLGSTATHWATQALPRSAGRAGRQGSLSVPLGTPARVRVPACQRTCGGPPGTSGGAVSVRCTS